jgi:hypothetical protein
MMTTKPDVIINYMELQVVIYISKYRAAAVYSETEVQVQVFSKQIRQLMKIQKCHNTQTVIY